MMKIMCIELLEIYIDGFLCISEPSSQIFPCIWKSGEELNLHSLPQVSTIPTLAKPPTTITNTIITTTELLCTSQDR